MAGDYASNDYRFALRGIRTNERLSIGSSTDDVNLFFRSACLGRYVMVNQPTIVLVHGALSDASIWNDVMQCLQSLGHTIIAPAIPLRGLKLDAEYLSAFLKTIEGPIIVVGHSYGGSIISHPAVSSDHVKALVFVAAFAPNAGESTGQLNRRFPGSKMTEETVIVRKHPGGDDLYLRPEHFSNVYAADLPSPLVALMAATQRPIEVDALSETFDGSPTWRRVPSWAIVATADDSLPPEAQRYMASRAASTLVEIKASHALPVSQPQAVADVIVEAARAVSGAEQLMPRRHNS
jgi:pimeloyl-ACP methyl ester carboxylesterase